MKRDKPSLCPAFSGFEKSSLLGIRQLDKIAILPNPLELDQEFIDKLKSGLIPEHHFRFVSPCRTGGCMQWKGHRCSVAAQVVKFVKSKEMDCIPECSIRDDCRWYGQEGLSICQVCPYVITDMQASEVAILFAKHFGV